MWTQWYIYYTNQNSLYTCYANAPGATTFASNWQEPGEHYETEAKKDFNTFAGTLEGGGFVFRQNPLRLGFDGDVEQ